MNRFSSFVLKTSTHKGVVVRWAHLAERAGSPQDKERAALQVAKQIADWQANNQHCVKVPD